MCVFQTVCLGMIIGVALSQLTSTRLTGVGKITGHCILLTVSAIKTLLTGLVCVFPHWYLYIHVGYSSHFKWSVYLRQPGPVPAPAFIFTKVCIFLRDCNVLLDSVYAYPLP